MKVLFIHPNEKLTQIYKPYLINHFQIDSAHDGLVGLRKLKSSRPNVVISDFQLPYVSGLSLLKFMRASPDLVRTPFIFLTNYNDPSAALSFGANDWLDTRTSTPDMLIEKIYQHLKTYAL